MHGPDHNSAIGVASVVVVAAVITIGAVVTIGALVPDGVVVATVCGTTVVEVDVGGADVVEALLSPQDTTMASNATATCAGFADLTTRLYANRVSRH